MTSRFKSSLVFALTFITILGSGAVSQAHPGHVIELVPSNSTMHFALQPDHSWPFLAVAALLTAFIACRRLRCLIASPSN